MKGKYFLTGLLFSMFISCDSAIIFTSGEFEYEPPSDVEMPKIEKDPYEILGWIENNMCYCPDEEEHWQPPHESITRKLGDCEDPVILSMYYFQMFGYEPYLLGAEHPNGRWHAFLEIDKNTWINFSAYIDDPCRKFFVVYLEADSIEVAVKYSWQDILRKQCFIW